MNDNCPNYNRLVSRIRVAMASYSDVNCDKIPMNAHIEKDLVHFFGYDNTAVLEVLSYIEVELEIKLDEHQDPKVLDLKTVRDLAAYISDYFKCIHFKRSHPTLDKHPELREHDKAEFYAGVILPVKKMTGANYLA